MHSDPPERAGEQDWRMQAELEVADRRGALRELVARLRGPNVVREIAAMVPDDVVITHDGNLLFAYAADEDALAAARRAIEEALARSGVAASVRVSHWDDERDEWRQTDPPLPAEPAAQAAERDAESPETRTLVVSSGRMIRAEFEQSMRDWADRLGLECEVIAHPHLLTTQLAFTVSGPRRKVEEFSRGLAAGEHATIRTEREVMLSPL